MIAGPPKGGGPSDRGMLLMNMTKLGTMAALPLLVASAGLMATAPAAGAAT